MLAIVKPTKEIEKIAGQNNIFQSIMLAYYRPIVAKEVNLSNINKDSKVLCIGGGYFPCTAILIHKISGAEVTVIDNDEKTIESAKKRIEKLGISKKVCVKYANGIEIDTKEYDMVHIAMQVSPKEEVFSNAFEKIHKKSKILIRVPKKHLKQGYHEFKISKKEKNFVKQPIFSNIRKTLLYVK